MAQEMGFLAGPIDQGEALGWNCVYKESQATIELVGSCFEKTPLGLPHPISELPRHTRILTSLLLIQLLANKQLWQAADDDQSVWESATHMGDLGGIPSSWQLECKTSVTRTLSLSFFLFNKMKNQSINFKS